MTMPIDRSYDGIFGYDKSSEKHRVIDAKDRFFKRRSEGVSARSRRAPRGFRFPKMAFSEWAAQFDFERHSRLILKLSGFKTKAYPFTRNEVRIITLLLFWRSKSYNNSGAQKIPLTIAQIALELNMDRGDVGNCCRVLSLCGIVVNIGDEKELNLVINPKVEQWQPWMVRHFRRWNRG
jgi:hypothetical protein